MYRREHSTHIDTVRRKLTMAGVVEIDELLSVYGYNGSNSLGSCSPQGFELAKIQTMINTTFEYNDETLTFMFAPHSRMFEVIAGGVRDCHHRRFDCCCPAGDATLTADDFVNFVDRVLTNIDAGAERSYF